MISKKRIGIIILCASVLLCICASGCIGVSNADTTANSNMDTTANLNTAIIANENPYVLMDYKTWGGATAEISVVVDPVTGINYIILREPYRAGICPRYDVDGNLYISEVA
ncbi:MAG: DUF6440 family protein [Endomicrobiaceae bacterium]|nr:DUF6440 family protein [Endomicrobiaceae bacterium]